MKTKQKDLKPVVAYSLITGAFIISLVTICYFYNQQADILNDSMDIQTERIDNTKHQPLETIKE